jgi:hypothetical protein
MCFFKMKRMPLRESKKENSTVTVSIQNTIRTKRKIIHDHQKIVDGGVVVWHIRDGQQAPHTKARRTKNEKPSEDAFFPESV